MVYVNTYTTYITIYVFECSCTIYMLFPHFDINFCLVLGCHNEIILNYRISISLIRFEVSRGFKQELITFICLSIKSVLDSTSYTLDNYALGLIN